MKKTMLSFVLSVLLILMTCLPAASASGSMTAEEITAILHQIREIGPTDDAQAAELFEQIRECDLEATVTEPADQLDLGMCFYRCAGDPAAAFGWWRKAAEQGDADAQYHCGMCCYFADGTEQDFEQAVMWYTLSAEQGLAGAQCYLADAYLFGDGVEQDEAKAVEWLTKAAEQGDEMALNNLAECYRFGTGVEQDEAKAVELYLASAETGTATAMYNLGECYEFGQGVEQDMDKAMEWYNKAAELGDPYAQEKISQKH